MRGYHHTVMVNATPFGDFTNWCACASMTCMPKKDPDAAMRRRKLKQWIDAKFDGNMSAAARAAGKPETQLIDTLTNPKRSFGARLARDLEEKYKPLGMPKYYLDTDDDEPLHAELVSGWPFRFSRALFDSLHRDEQLIIEGMVLGRIMGLKEDARVPAIRKRAAARGEKS